ncbi:MAG: HAD family hydrolase [Acidobacteriota bacterium]
MTSAATVDLWPKGVLFDLDGTLADSFPAIARALDRALRDTGLPARGLAWVHCHVGRGSAALVRDAVGAEADPDLAVAVERGYAARYREIYLTQTPPLPGSRDVLRFVSERTGRRVGVVSNKAGELCRAWLEHWGLVAFVGAVSGPDLSGWRKPDPRAVLPVLSALGLASEQALLVGDMAVDVETARAAGMSVVTVSGPAGSPASLLAAGAPVVLATLGDLPAWLAGAGRGWS